EAAAEAECGHQGREPRAAAQKLLAVHREQLAVAPEVPRPRCNGFAVEGAARAFEVVNGEQSPPAPVAGSDRFLGLLPAALSAFQPDDVAHGFLRLKEKRPSASPPRACFPSRAWLLPREASGFGGGRRRACPWPACACPWPRTPHSDTARHA